MSSSNIGKKYLTKGNVASFAIAGFGQNLIISMVNSYILFFYTDVFLIGAAPAGVLMIVARIWDAFNDPIMGTFVDKTRTKWGKMRPYILFAAGPLAVCTGLLFLNPDLGLTGKIIYAYVTYICWGMIYTVGDVPFWGLASAMTPNPVERVSFISTSRLVHSLGSALPMLLVPLIVGKLGNSRGYTVSGIVAGVVGGVLFLLAFLGTEERNKSAGNSPTLRECFSFLMLNKPLGCVVLANALGFLRAVPITAGMYVANYVLGEQTLSVFGKAFILNGTMLNTVLIAGWAVAGFVGMIFTPMLCKKMDYKQIFTVFSVVGFAASAALIFLKPSFAGVFICLLAVGLPYGIICNINYAMIADSVDYVEWITGKRTEGITVSFQTLMNKLMTALQSGAVSIALIVINFAPPVKNALGETVMQAQSETTLRGLYLLISLLPAIGWALSIIPMRFYRFIGAERDLVTEELEQRRNEVKEPQNV